MIIKSNGNKYECNRIYHTDDSKQFVAVVDQNEVIFGEYSPIEALFGVTIDELKRDGLPIEYTIPYPTRRAINLLCIQDRINGELNYEDMKYIIKLDRNFYAKGKLAWCVLWYLYLGLFTCENDYYISKVKEYVSNQGWPIDFE